MGTRPAVMIGIVAGVVWALFVVGASIWAGLPYIAAPVALPTALFAPGLVIIMMIGCLAFRWLIHKELFDHDPEPGSGYWIDRSVLANTTEQVILALITWPFIAVSLGGAVVIAMGVGFAITRLLFWIGFHVSRPLCVFGLSGTFFPTVLASIWSVVVWIN